MEDPSRKPRRSDGKNNRSLFRRTIFLMAVLGIGMFLPLVAQLYRLQIVEHEEWERRAANQQTRSVSVAANRGTIYDREGRAMAMSATVYKLILNPIGVYNAVSKDNYKDEDGNLKEAEYEKALYDLRKTIVDGIVDLFGYDEERLWKRVERIESGYEVLYYELEEEDAEKARQFISENKLSAGLQLTPSSKRYYPYSSIGSHVLGFVHMNETSGDNKVGGSGIEALYEDVLSGELGRVVTSKNGRGMEMISGYEMIFDAENGYDIHLTLDERIQAMLEQTLAEGIETYDVQAGAFGLAINPQTGAVLAMASTPDFDPHSYNNIINDDLQASLDAIAAEYGTDSDEYDKALRKAQNEQRRNRVLTETYEPGSVFKPITVAIALEEGVISMDDHFYCSGGKVVGGRNISCHNSSGHKDQDLTKAVGNSCNVALMNIAEEIGAETTWKYWKDFGLFEPTGIDLAGEQKGIFWNESYFKSANASGQELATSSFGQRFKVTPLEMITAFAAVINGGHLLEPYLVQSVSDQDGNTVFYHETQEVRQVVSESTSDKVRGILESVVANDSGHNAYQIGYRIGGKTGTSELLDRKNNPDYPDYDDDVMCSFMGFAPVDDPQVLVLVVYDTPKRSSPGSNYTASGTYLSGGNIAAPMAGALIANILDYMGIEKQYSADELAGADTLMPYVIGKELTVAKGTLQNQGFECRTVGTGSIVTHQVPAAGVYIPGGSNVILYLGDEAPETQVETPDLSGLSPAAAKSRLEEAGLFMRATGVVDYTDATVVMAAQSVDPGTMVSPGTVVQVRFVSSIEYGDQGGL